MRARVDSEQIHFPKTPQNIYKLFFFNKIIKMKKSLVIISFAFILLLSMSVVSAGWLGDFWSKVTGKAAGPCIGAGCSVADVPSKDNLAAAGGENECLSSDDCSEGFTCVADDDGVNRCHSEGAISTRGGTFQGITSEKASAATTRCGYPQGPSCDNNAIAAARGSSCSDVLRRGDTCTKVYSKTFTSPAQVTEVRLTVTKTPIQRSGQAKGPSPSCIDDVGCTSGLKKCSGTGYQTCGNYDADKCLEWSSVTSCGVGKTCTAGGVCVGSTLTASSPTSAGALKGCTDECSQGDKQCSGNGYITCGNFFSNPCKEFGGPVISCGPGETCSGGNCVACTDECSPQYSQGCVGSSSNRTCGNYDPDSCLEWSPTTPCVLNQSCASGKC